MNFIRVVILDLLKFPWIFGTRWPFMPMVWFFLFSDTYIHAVEFVFPILRLILYF